MSIIKNNTSSPFKMKYSSPLDAAAAQVSYEFPSTEATHGSNEGLVAAIEGIGKIAGEISKYKKEKKEEDGDDDNNPLINKLGKR